MSTATGDAWLVMVMGYVPSKTAAVIFAIVYGVLALAFAARGLQTRTAFTLIITATALVECIGYVARYELLSSATVGVYTIQTLCILLAPNALALVNYKVLGQLVVLKQPVPTGNLPLKGERPCLRVPWVMDGNTGLIRGDRVSSLFFGSDIVSFIVQMAGGGMMAQQSMASTGETVMIIGLVLQLGFYALFTVLAIYVYRSDIYNEPRSEFVTVKPLPCGKTGPRALDTLLLNSFNGLFLTILLLTVRNIYRFIEAATGRLGYLSTHEPYILVFDGALIACTFVVFYWYDLCSALTLVLRSKNASVTSIPIDLATESQSHRITVLSPH